MCASVYNSIHSLLSEIVPFLLKTQAYAEEKHYLCFVLRLIEISPFLILTVCVFFLKLKFCIYRRRIKWVLLSL